MIQKLTKCLLTQVRESSPRKIQVGIPVKEGQNLPNSVTEDVGGFSLIPTYSAKQLREISRRHEQKIRSQRISKNNRRMIQLW